MSQFLGAEIEAAPLKSEIGGAAQRGTPAGPARATTCLPGIDLNDRTKQQILFVDLSNFSSFPTYAIGLLVANLRNHGHDVRVLVPLAHGVPATVREHREGWADFAVSRIRFSTWSPFQRAQNVLRLANEWRTRRPDRRVLREVVRAIDGGAKLLLLSAYLEHYRTVRAIGEIAAARGVPMLIGGSVFNLDGPADTWRHLPGVTAIVGAECDLSIAAIARTALERGDLLQFPGVTLPDGTRSEPAAPQRDLDQIAVPDFSDFPWDRYRARVIPLMTGRGCQWGRCKFCSDVVTASGLSYRTRSVGSVLDEMREQSLRLSTKNFLFLDIKLNSNPGMFRGIIEGVQRHVPGAQWIGTVHVDGRRDNGLSKQDLTAAARAGMRRVSFGLESGSQTLLDSMVKGCDIGANEEFLRNAHGAGLSVRCTMIQGYPGETAEDLDVSASFLRRNRHFIDRLRLSKFSVPEGTPIYYELRDRPELNPEARVARLEPRDGRLRCTNHSFSGRAYRNAKARLLREVHEINRREVAPAARMFDGMM